jgi:hypothetical protein
VSAAMPVPMRAARAQGGQRADGLIALPLSVLNVTSVKPLMLLLCQIRGEPLSTPK